MSLPICAQPGWENFTASGLYAAPLLGLGSVGAEAPGAQYRGYLGHSRLP